MKNLFLILFGLSAVIGSCKKSVVDSSNITAKGTVLLIDENNHPLSDYSGVIITSENSDTKIPVDVNGEFDFPSLPNNSSHLTLIFSKLGYGTVTQDYTKAHLDSCVTQSSTISDIVLLPLSSVTVNSLVGILDGDKFKMTFNVSFDQVKPTNGVTFFLSKNNSQVSYNNCIGNNANSRTWTVPVTSGENLNSFCFTRTIDCNCDFLASGDTVYVKAYGDTYSPFGNSYFDSRSSKLIFPNINANTGSATISFVVP
jgi:hypothetical protein